MKLMRAGSQPSQQGPEDYFTGTVRIDPLYAASEPARVSAGQVTFEPGARSAWHTHPLGQILVVTAGCGWTQCEGEPIVEIRAGDTIWCPPGHKHWHGASPTTAMTHIAIQEALDGKAVIWMEKVTDEQYLAGPPSAGAADQDEPMTDRPRIICLMTSSLDGRLHPSRYTSSPDGSAKDWSAAYEALHDELAADAWLVGRTTMAEMTTGEAHPPKDAGSSPRPIHLAETNGPFAIAIDRSGKLHFAEAHIGGDPVVVLLGPDVPDAHLAELVCDGISYIVAADKGMALPPFLDTLKRELGIETLLLEGGGGVNGSFLAAGLVDELYMILAPALDGSPSTAIVEAGEAGLKGKVTLSLLNCDRLGGGALRLQYAVSPDTA